MTARFIPPAPNCGHVTDITWRFDRLAAIWMCFLCALAIRGLRRAVCSACGKPPWRDTHLVSTLKGRLCFACRRDRASAHRH